MIDLLSNMQVVLQDAGFTTRLGANAESPIVCFENESLIGFGSIFNDPADLLSRWKEVEEALLVRYSLSFRRAGDKAWNVYSVFLCGLAADASLSRQVRWIEEDLHRTRKVTGCGLTSREDMVRALLPLLPIQQQPILQIEDTTERLNRRIRTIAPRAADVVLDESVLPSEVVRLLGGPV